MKFPFSSAVVGTSFRPEVAAGARPGQRVFMRAEPDNPFDPNAVAVELEGQQLGYLPRALAARLQGGPWAGEIAEVFGSSRLGIRIRVVGPVEADLTKSNDGKIRDGAVRIPSSQPNAAVNRYTIDSTQRQRSPQTMNDTVNTASTTATQPSVAPLPEVEEIVKARSGRILGSFVKVDGDQVHVLNDNGRTVSYPAALVTREQRKS